MSIAPKIRINQTEADGPPNVHAYNLVWFNGLMFQMIILNRLRSDHSYSRLWKKTYFTIYSSTPTFFIYEQTYRTLFNLNN